jgi:hemolysin III
MTPDTVPSILVDTKPRLRGVSHLYAFFVTILAAGALVASAPAGVAVVGVTIYGAALVGMFGASALYHRPQWSPSRARWFLKLDHTAIFFVIAGTATPIVLLTSDGAMRALVLAVLWTVAAGGIVFEWLPVDRPRGYVTTVYLVLGWLGLLALGGLWDHTGVPGVLLVLAGGAFYTAGALVHAARRPDPWPRVFGYHELFHALVIAAAACHYCAIAFFVLPQAA